MSVSIDTSLAPPQTPRPPHLDVGTCWFSTSLTSDTSRLDMGREAHVLIDNWRHLRHLVHLASTWGMCRLSISLTSEISDTSRLDVRRVGSSLAAHLRHLRHLAPQRGARVN